MDNSTRLQYLEAMGIDVWISRKASQVEEIQVVGGTEIHVTEQAESQFEAVTDKWAALQKEVSECQKCTLCNTRTQTVFGTGNVNADWMFIGEAPGQNEDLEGKPFVGQAGKLLTEMIRAIGLEREAVYIANILKCRPPNNRDPKVEEVKTCNDYLQRQITLIKPKIILAVGRISAQTLLETNEPLSRLRGVSHQLNNIPLVVVYHPAYLLRSLLEKRKAWQDLQLAMKIYKEIK
ncbi:MAG: uracil-DNA glycosylase [Methylococcales bacterium]|nr:uracil-DNA glycosylase [Methylococcales bacterium]